MWRASNVHIRPLLVSNLETVLVTAMARAAMSGDDARQFASALRVLWFAGYLQDSWFGSTAAAPVPLLTAVSR
jgi:hypothetical protein